MATKTDKPKPKRYVCVGTQGVECGTHSPIRKQTWMDGPREGWQIMFLTLTEEDTCWDQLPADKDHAKGIWTRKIIQGLRKTPEDTYYCSQCMRRDINAGGPLNDLTEDLNKLLLKHDIGSGIKMPVHKSLFDFTPAEGEDGGEASD